MKKGFFKASVLSLATAVVLGMTACSGGGGDSSTTTAVTTSGGAVDGYLQNATVFVDTTADGEQNATEQSTTTNLNGDFTLTGTIADGTKIYAYGGIDRSTGKPFEGRLSAVYQGKSPILSPLSTYVAALVDRNVSIADAKTLVAQNLGISADDVEKDPMTTPSVFLASQKVQKTVEVIAAATGDTDFNQAYENVFTSLAKVTENNTTGGDFNATVLVTEVESNQSVTIDSAIDSFLETYVAKVDEIADENVSTTALDGIGDVLNTYTEVVESAIENNDTTAVADYETALTNLDANTTVVQAEDGNITDPLVEALDKAQSAIDNNISYLGTNTADNNITTNLVLTNPTAAPFNTNDLNLTWSSNDADLNVTTGGVTRGYADKEVVLKATVEASVSGVVATNNKTFNLTIKRIEAAPVAVDKNVTISEDANATSVDLSGSVDDLNNDPLTITAIGTASYGTATLTNGVVTYTPYADFNGADSFSYTVSDGTGLSTTANVYVTVTAVNDAPVANNDANTTLEETTLTFDVTANDTDVDGDTLSVSAISDLTNGTASFSGTNITYTPAMNFVGVETIEYTVSDGNGGESNATVTITVVNVNDAPVANNDANTTLEETALTFDVTANDTDVDGDTLSVSAISDPTNGTASFSGTNVTYTPTTDFNGTDSFQYTVSDGNGGESNATVIITVVNVNDIPVATDVSISTNEDTNVTGIVSATDVDGNLNPNGYSVVTQPSSGIVSMDTNGTFTFSPNGAFESLAQDANTTVTFTYTASDDTNTSTPKTVTVTVNGVNDVPVLSSSNPTDESIRKTVDLNITVSATDVDTGAVITLDDANATGATVTFDSSGNIIFNADSNGTYTINYALSDEYNATVNGTIAVTVTNSDVPEVGNDIVTINEDNNASIAVLSNDSDDFTADVNLTLAIETGPSNGSAVIETNNTITYIPNSNYNGTDSFQYRVTDEDGGFATADVNITVNAVNDAPVIGTVSAVTVAEDSNTTYVDLNITDVDTNLSTIAVSALSSAPTIVTVDVNWTGTNYTLALTPQPNAHSAVDINVTVNDGNAIANQFFTFTVTPVNDAPTAVDDNVSALLDTTLVGIDVLANDYDVDDNNTNVNLMIVSCETNTTQGGSVLYDASSVTSYTPATDFTGLDTFQCTISDELNVTATETIYVYVSGNHAPEASNAQFTMVVGEVLTGRIDAYDADGDTLTYSSSLGGDAVFGSATTLDTNGSFAIDVNATGTGYIYVDIFDGNVTTSVTYTVNVTQPVMTTSDELSEGATITSAEFNASAAATTARIPADTKLYAVWGDTNLSVGLDYLMFDSNGTFVMKDSFEVSTAAHDGSDSNSDGYFDDSIVQVSMSADFNASNVFAKAIMIDDNMTAEDIAAELPEVALMAMPSGAVVYKTAVQMMQEEYDIWGPAGDGNTSYGNFAEMINNDANGIIAYSKVNTKRILVFDSNQTYEVNNSNGTVVEVDITDPLNPFVTNPNAGTWNAELYSDENLTDVEMVKVTVDDSLVGNYDKYPILVQTDVDAISQGHYNPAGTAFIEYRFNDVAAAVIQNKFDGVTAQEWIDNIQEGNITQELNASTYADLGVGLIDPKGVVVHELHINSAYPAGFEYETTDLNFASGGTVYINEFINGQADSNESYSYTVDGTNEVTISDNGTDIYKLKITDEYNATEITQMTGIEMPEGAVLYKMAGLNLVNDFYPWEDQNGNLYVAEVRDANGTVVGSNLPALTDMVDAAQLADGRGFATRYDGTYVYALGFDHNISSGSSGTLLEINLDTNDTAVAAGTWAIVSLDINNTTISVLEINATNEYGPNAYVVDDNTNVVIGGNLEYAYTGEESFDANDLAMDVFMANFQNQTDFSYEEVAGTTVYGVITDAENTIVDNFVTTYNSDPNNHTRDLTMGSFTPDPSPTTQNYEIVNGDLYIDTTGDGITETKIVRVRNLGTNCVLIMGDDTIHTFLNDADAQEYLNSL